ncbi:Uncharacterised protein [Chromobacterium violaceum]|uniref:ArnT-like N-terminal domain-containing protein n=1 Tax=Chromobacterium violaceum TaxID=536 RepID=A0A447T728_CHRVL|nr:Uncharacterised protein [Chromobacterium violaceum]
MAAVSLTARRLWGAEAGRHAALAAGGMAWIVANSHFLSLDMGVSFFLTAALCGFLLAQRAEASREETRWAMWLTWAAMAGATLSKGLIGLLIPAPRWCCTAWSTGNGRSGNGCTGSAASRCFSR